MRMFHANYNKGNIKMHLYLKFEREIFKIVKVMAVLVVFLNARASRATTCMHVLSCKYDSSMTVAYDRQISNTSISQV